MTYEYISMDLKFNNLIQVTEKFSDEAKCREYLAGLRWKDGKAICPYCNHFQSYVIENGKRYKCANTECHKKYSVTVGTIFEGSKLPLRKWFIAIYLITNHRKGISSHQLGRDLGVTQKSAWFVLHRIREMLAANAPHMLEGTVEVDETYIGGKRSNKHADERKRMNESGTGYLYKTPVFGMLQRDGVVYTQMPKEATGQYLKPIIFEKVREGSTVMSDGFGGYYGLSKYYHHEIINHQQGEYYRDGYHTNTLEGFWGLLKRGIVGIYHYVSPKHLQRYCDEFSFRYNLREAGPQDRLDATIRQSIGGRLTYKKLTA